MVDTKVVKEAATRGLKVAMAVSNKVATATTMEVVADKVVVGKRLNLTTRHLIDAHLTIHQKDDWQGETRTLYTPAGNDDERREEHHWDMNDSLKQDEA